MLKILQASLQQYVNQELQDVQARFRKGRRRKKERNEVAQSCLTLCDPVDCSPPGSSIHGILQARILEWVAISFSRGSSQPRDRTQVSCIASGFFTSSHSEAHYVASVVSICDPIDCRLQFMGLQRIRHDRSDLASTYPLCSAEGHTSEEFSMTEKDLKHQEDGGSGEKAKVQELRALFFSSTMEAAPGSFSRTHWLMLTSP